MSKIRKFWISREELFDILGGGRFPLTTIDAANVGGLTPGSIPFADAVGFLTEDNPNLFFDAANIRLGVGIGAPVCTGHFQSAVCADYAGIHPNTVLLLENDTSVALQLQAATNAEAHIIFADDDFNPPAGAIEYDFANDELTFAVGMDDMVVIEADGANSRITSVHKGIRINSTTYAAFIADAHDADAYFELQEDNALKWTMGFDYSDSLKFQISEGAPGTNVRFEIVPATQFNFYLDVVFADGVSLSLQEDIAFTGATTQNLIKFPDNLANALSFMEGANAYLTFITTNGSEAIYIQENVGIGTPTPAGELEIEGDTPVLLLDSTDARGERWQIQSTYGGAANTGTFDIRDEGGDVWASFGQNAGSPQIVFKPNAVVGLLIDSSGDVLINNDIALSSGSITSVSGAISFGNENLSTTGTLGAGNSTLGTISCGTIGCGTITVANGSSLNLQEDITFTGASAQNLIKFPDNLANALDFREGGTSYLAFVTTNGAELIKINKRFIAATNCDIGTLNFKNGIISDSGGSINFDNENLSTTGTLNVASNLLSVGEVAGFVGVGTNAPDDELELRGASAIVADPITLRIRNTEVGGNARVGQKWFLGADLILDLLTAPAWSQFRFYPNSGIMYFTSADDIVFRANYLNPGGGAISFRYDETNSGLQINSVGGVFMPALKSGINQGAAGAAANELWFDTNDDNTVKMGV